MKTAGGSGEARAGATASVQRTVAEREELRRRLAALGFDEVRFASAGPAPAGAALGEWIEQGHAADMAWIARSAAKRMDPEQVLPGARTMVMLGVNYWRDGAGGGGSLAEVGGERRARWARYALNEDYHDTIKAALAAAGQEIEALFGANGGDYRYYVDTGPVLERAWAAEAGLGFVGKNAMLISRRFGNWLFLAAVLMRVELPPDQPLRTRVGAAVTGGQSEGVGALCGKCTRCLDACPTAALRAPGVLDARRCISYQTIENRGVIPVELRAGIGDRIYGCDVCAEVCPWNRFAQDAKGVLLVARAELAELGLRDILRLTPDGFAAVFRRTAVKRLKLTGLLRNACIVAANTGARDCLEELVALTAHASPMVRAHAVWAVRRLGADARLADRRETETDEDVRRELLRQA